MIFNRSKAEFQQECTSTSNDWAWIQLIICYNENEFSDHEGYV